jgi:hypothetical protein
MGDQRRPISKPYILASLLIAIVIWATMGSPTVGARSGSNIRKSMLTPSTFPVARNNTDWR